MRIVAFIVDVLVIGLCTFFVMGVTGSLWYGIVASVVVAAYGVWCFTDGARRMM